MNHLGGGEVFRCRVAVKNEIERDASDSTKVVNSVACGANTRHIIAEHNFTGVVSFAMGTPGFLFLAVAMLAIPSLATAGLHDKEWNPPAQFEQSFPDNLVIHKVEPADVAKACEKMWKRTGYVYAALPDHGCSSAKDGVCEVVIPSRPIEGATPIAILRHEIGHCAGWPAGHPD
jgi:hypothetical protein